MKKMSQRKEIDRVIKTRDILEFMSVSAFTNNLKKHGTIDS